MGNTGFQVSGSNPLTGSSLNGFPGYNSSGTGSSPLAGGNLNLSGFPGYSPTTQTSNPSYATEPTPTNYFNTGTVTGPGTPSFNAQPPLALTGQVNTALTPRDPNPGGSALASGAPGSSNTTYSQGPAVIGPQGSTFPPLTGNSNPLAGNVSNTPYSQLNPTTAGFSQNAGASSPAGYYQQPLSNVIAGQGYQTSPTFATYLAGRVAGTRAEGPGAIAAQQASSSNQLNQPAGFDSWTPAAQWAYDYAQTHPDAPEVQSAGSVQAFTNQYNDPSKYSYQALTGYTPFQLANAPKGTSYQQPNVANTGYGQVIDQANNALSGAPSPGPSNSTPPAALPSTYSVNQGTPGTVTAPAETPPASTGNNNASLSSILQYILGGGNNQSSVGTTPLGYTQYQQPTSNSSSGLSPQILALLASVLGGQKQSPQQVPLWYL